MTEPLKQFKVPLCGKCGKNHYNVHACPKPQPPPDYLRRQPAPDGFKYSGEWGVNTRSAPLIYTLPPQPRHGTITRPDGTPHTPDAA